LGLGVFVVAVLYIAPLFLDAPLTDPNEGLHAAVSQEMVERGDLIVPRFLGRAFLDKPILFFWAQAASLRLFGMSTAAARLPGILFALLGIVTTGWLAQTLMARNKDAGPDETASVGLVAAVCHATMVLPFLLAQAPVHDIALVPFTNVALGFLWRADRHPESALRDRLLAAVSLGLSILTKGLEGVAIVGVAYALYLILTRAVTWRLILHGVMVLAVAMIVAAPWYLVMNAREPGYLWYYFFERHVLGFATNTQRHSGQPWWFYLAYLAGGGLPWLVLIRSRRLLLWTWLGGGVALLSLSGSKAVTYVLPALPALAILAAASAPVTRVWRGVATAATVVYAGAVMGAGPFVARTHSARDVAEYFNASGQLPPRIFVFDQRLSFVYYLRPELRAQLRENQVRSISLEELAAMEPLPHGAVVAVPADLAAGRLPRIPQLAGAKRHVAGRYLLVVR
jgi:4-amino-4-deoxy-L-arabinose transferase-like glycosyltransferase